VSSGGAGDEARRYGRAAGLLSVAIGAAGLLTYVFFAIASHTLSKDDYGEIVVLWSAVFITVSTLFRPVEQLLSRTIAEHEAHGEPTGHAVRVAASIQLGLAAAYAVAALTLRDVLEDDLLSGNETLYWVMVGGVLAFGASFFARGFLAGGRHFGTYSVVLLAESIARVSFALLVAVGIADGQNVVALGVAAAPGFSLLVIPFAVRYWSARATPPVVEQSEGQLRFSLTRGGGFAAAVLVIMVSEQTLLNAGPLIVKGAEGAAAAGFIFNVLMLARAPLVLFQAAATSLLPHLTRLRSRGGEVGTEAFSTSIRLTMLAIAGFAAIVAVFVLAAGPELMQLAFGKKFEYDRAGLIIVTGGMALYLAAATLNQAALARGQVRRAAAAWLGSALCFLGFNFLPILDEFRRVEVGFAAAASLLCLLLLLLYRTVPEPDEAVLPGSPEEIEARLATADEAG
jgi:O-antigen/teichoic acid export membrane protein